MKKRQKQKASFPVLQLSEGILNDQVYHAIRAAILDGRLQVNMKIPSSRALSEMMAVSRNTVLAGMDRLVDEGYLYTKAGSGTYVSAFLPERLSLHHESIQSTQRKKLNAPALSEALQTLAPKWHNVQKTAKENRVFSIGVGCVDLFPQQTWGRILGRVWRQSANTLAKYSSAMGYLPLREALAHYMQSTRGLICRSEQIMFVNGTQQAINLTAKVLLDHGDEVLFDEPGYDCARDTLEGYGAVIRTVDSDVEGMMISAAMKDHPNVKLVYTAPSHQFPLGGTLSLARRLALLEWAERESKWIFEDDYNGEFRYQSRAIQALQGLDRAGNVIYSGTFSKMIYPGFRLAFLVLPDALVEPFKIAKHYADSCTGYLEQATLAMFIEEGEYAKYVRKVRKACLERQQAMVNALEKYLPHVFVVQPSDSGIHTVTWLKDGWNVNEIIAICQSLSLGAQPLQSYATLPLARDAVLFGYAAHSVEEITLNIQRLAEVINNMRPLHKDDIFP